MDSPVRIDNGLRHSEMEVRTGRISGVARIAEQLSLGNDLARPDNYSICRKMNVLRR